MLKVNVWLKRAGLYLVTFLVCCSVLSSTQASAGESTTQNYADLTLSSPSTSETFSGVWDLTQGDLTLFYTIDLTGVNSQEPNLTSWTSVGLMNCDGDSGWMGSGAPQSWATDPDSLDLDDKHNLAAPDRYSEPSYDATDPDTVTDPPFGTYDNYGIWFDRDGVDQWQAGHWGATDGGTYNTSGIYDVVITYHAISSNLGTMFSTVNGIQTGFYTTGWQNAQPEYYPAGKSLTGDMTEMRPFARLSASDDTYGDVTLSNITITGYLSEDQSPCPGEGGGGCFIATAAYGTSTAAEIDTLRAFRDEVLLQNSLGSQLVEWYYHTSPPLADFISRNGLLRTIVRELLVDRVASLVEATEAIWGD